MKNIDHAFELAKTRNWNKIYVAIDLHGTIFKSTYGGFANEFYPEAKETLQYLSSRKDIVLIIWSSSYPEDLKKYKEFLKDNNIDFKYINENPECENTKTGYFVDKFYFSIILDDKANFDPESWDLIYINFKHYENYL